MPIHVRGRHMIEQAMNFRAQLLAWWGERRVPVVHVRSIYEGYPLARAKGKLVDSIVYEVNGLPSIELKYHYPRVADDHELLAKLHAQEQTLLDAADLIVTPSAVTAEHLTGIGADPGRVRVIPNGVDLDIFTYREPRPWGDREVRILYCGTLTAWQGIRYALEALRLYRRDFPATLTVVGHGRNKRRREILDLCLDVGLGGAVTLLEPVSQVELAALYHEHDVAVAPLPPNDRNLVQGCCPLKILESMAAGTPVIASDMQVVRDLANNGQDALLVKAGSAKAIKDAMLVLREDPELPVRLARSARQRIERHHTWSAAGESLIDAYGSLYRSIEFPGEIPGEPGFRPSE